MGSDATLQNTSVNNGTAVKLNAESITYAWKNMIKDNAVSSKYDTSEVTYTGFENPTIVVQGVIPIDNLPTNSITQPLLVDFATVRAGDITFAVTAGTSVMTQLKGRPSAGYSVTGTNATTMTSTMKVQVESFNITFSAGEYVEGQGWHYSLNLIETT